MTKPRLSSLVPGLQVALLLIFALVGAGVHAEDAPQFQITSKRGDDRVTVKVDDGRAVVDIRSPFGISNATIERTASEWPKAVVLRLHLKGLEHYQVTSGELVIAGSAPSRPKPEPVGDEEDRAADGVEKLKATIRMFHEDGKPASEIPLKSGYFEIELPGKLLEGNARSLRVEWVDFYRG